MILRWTGWLAGAAFGLLTAAAVLWGAGRAPEDRGASIPAPLLPEDHGALEHVVLHFVPASGPLLEPTHRDFLSAISSNVRVTFVIPQGTRQALRAHLRAIGAGERRIDVLEVPGPITPWSKDRALITTADTRGQGWLVAPAKPDCSWLARCNDWQTVPLLAAHDDHFSFQEAPFDFDAGDFAVAGHTVIVDTNLLEKNRHRGIADVATLRRRLRTWLAMPVVVLGKQPGDTPQHHLAMYMTPAGEDTVLVGDPSMAHVLVGDSFSLGQSSAETGRPLLPDFSAASQARFDFAARELERAGFRVVRIPNVPFDEKTYVTYTNGVYETAGRRRIAYVPVYEEDALDAAARETYEKLGWEVRPIRVRSLVPHHGTIGCLVNVVDREGGE